MRTADQNLNLALGFHRKGQLDRAEKHYKYVLKARPTDVTAQHLLGVIHYQKGKFALSKILISKALKQSPNDPMIQSNLGNSCQAMGDYDAALSLFDQSLRSQRGNPQVLANRGNAKRALGRIREAIADYQAALQIEPGLWEARRNLGISLQDERRYEDALPLLEQCLQQAPRTPESHLALANLCRDMGDMERAKEFYASAKGLGADQGEVDCELALALRDMGEIEAARSSLMAAIAKKPDMGRAWRALVNLGKYEIEDAPARLKSALKKAQDETDKMHLEFALAKVLEDRQDFKQAFIHYENANRRHRSQLTYNVADDLKVFNEIKNKLNRNFIERFQTLEHPSTSPIFITGMPRSGTSLVEQIISAHSTVYGAGEVEYLSDAISRVFPMADGQNFASYLPRCQSSDLQAIAAYYLEKVNGLRGSEFARISDKLPMNFMRIGLIRVVFPQAKIIHCRRSPMATCWSIFKNHLPANGHYYSTTLEDLAAYYKGYEDLMAHWEQLFPGQIIHITYEELVGAPQTETESLLNQLGLEHEDACFQPHKNPRPVRTLSATQVREPIYTGSIDRWRNFEDDLGPLLKGLKNKSYE